MFVLNKKSFQTVMPPKKIIGLSGKIGCGKTTTIQSMRALYPDCIVEYNFADLLKQFVADMYNFDVALCYTTEGKQTVPDNCTHTVGELLQIVGTSARNVFGENFWAHQLMDKIERETNQQQVVLIGDVRYPNEVSIIENQSPNNLVVRLYGDPGKVRQQSKRNLYHISETALDDHNFGRFCINTDTTSTKAVAQKVAEFADF